MTGGRSCSVTLPAAQIARTTPVLALTSTRAPGDVNGRSPRTDDSRWIELAGNDRCVAKRATFFHDERAEYWKY